MKSLGIIINSDLSDNTIKEFTVFIKCLLHPEEITVMSNRENDIDGNRVVRINVARDNNANTQDK